MFFQEAFDVVQRDLLWDAIVKQISGNHFLPQGLFLDKILLEIQQITKEPL